MNTIVISDELAMAIAQILCDVPAGKAAWALVALDAAIKQKEAHRQDMPASKFSDDEPPSGS